MPNPFDQFDGQVQPVPVQSLRPIIGSVTPEEQARKDREAELREEANARANAADARAAAAEERAAAKFAAGGAGDGVAVPVGAANDAKANVSQYTSLTRALNTFKDDFGGNPLGGLENVTEGSILGLGTEGQSEWWADFKTTDNLIRNTLFGASLTEGEKAAYNATTVTPSMKPEKIKANLTRRQEIIKGALQREREFFIANGYKPQAVDVLFRPVLQEGPTEEAAVNAPPPAEGEQRKSPLATAGQTRAAGEGEAFLTTEQQQALARFTEAYDRGATLEELRSIAATPFATQEELDEARRQGRRPTLTPMGRDPRDEMGTLEAIGETITGSARTTPEIDALPDWTDMPLPIGLMEQFQTGLATMMSSPEETARIMASMVPGLTVRQDAKGNYILRNPADGKEYAIKPGFQASDIPRAIGAVAAFTPAGRAATLPGAIAANAGTQAAIEASQAASGGTFDTGEIVAAGGTAGALNLAGQGVRAGRSAIASRRAAPEVPPMAPPPPPAAGMADEAAAPAAPIIPGAAAENVAAPAAESVTEVVRLAETAGGRGAKARQAKEQLAIVAKINPEAKAAVDRLGIEVPMDILSDDTRLLTATGLARSQPSSIAETEWLDVTRRVIQEADDTLRQVGGSRDLGQLSLDVRTRLQSDMDALQKAAQGPRDEVNAAINVRDLVEAPNMRTTIQEVIADFGGPAQAKLSMTSEEKKLLAMLGTVDKPKPATYAALNRIRDQIGSALFKNEGPWVPVDKATLKRYYGALAQDQLQYVESVGGADLATKMKLSNDNFSKMYDVRDAMQAVFGAKLEKDIAGVVRNAITEGAKGQGKDLRTVLNNVPEDMQSRALITSLMAEAEKGAASPYGGFSFKNYANLYRGLRQNSPIYAEIAKTIGKDKAQVLQDLYALSTRMATAEAKVIKTGKANNPVLNALKAEGLVGSIAKGSVRAGGRVVGGMAGGATMGPLGAVGGQEAGGRIADALVNAGKNELDQMHTVLSSESFRDLVMKVSAGESVDGAVNRVANDGAFRRFAKVLGINDAAGRKAWLKSAITVGSTTQAKSEEELTMIEVR